MHVPMMLPLLLILGAAAPARADDPSPGATAPAGAGATAASVPVAAQEGEAAPPPSADGVRRVMYVPEAIKAQLRKEIEEQVMARAQRERWAAPGAFPEWIRRIELHGDVRARYERDVFPAGNDNAGGFPDFNAINSGKPFDMNGIDLANDRFLNVDQDRDRPRLRARLALDVDAGGGVSAGLRFASGDGAGPVSTNQTLGTGFARYQFWLDRAFIRYEPVRGEGGGLAFDVGRFENPFLRTELVWDDDVNLDGLAVRARFPLGGRLRPFLVGGAFPVYTTAFGFPPERTDKFESLDRWLFAGQLGAGWDAGWVSARLGAAYYRFQGIEGRASSPCDTHLKDVSCDTDHSRPAFAQKGNTYFDLRTPSPEALAAEASGDAPRYQYFGLASGFQELAATGRLDLRAGARLKIVLEGEYVRNLAFSKGEVAGEALNNRGSCPEDEDCVGPYEGGDQGWLGRVTFGSPGQDGRWDWNVGVSYRYVESDAVVDAFVDSDFGLGGTNLEGFTVSGGLAFGNGLSTAARWLTASSIVGPPLDVDVMQVDVSMRF